MSNSIVNPTTKSALLSAKRPLETKSYAPVPHKVVIETVLEAFDKANLQVLSEEYKEARDGRQANGIYQLNTGDNEMNVRLIWQNSYDKSLPLVSAMGGHVIVCSNGLIVGDMGKFKRKHTGTVLQEFQEEIGMYINQAGEIFEKMKKDRELMKNIDITSTATAELIGRMFLEEDLITATQIGIIKRELENPSFDYKANGSVWQKYNAVTLALKESHPTNYIKSHVDVHGFFAKEFELV